MKDFEDAKKRHRREREDQRRFTIRRVRRGNSEVNGD